MANPARGNPPAPLSNTRALALATFASVLAAGAALGLNGTGNLGWHAAVRITAVVSFPLWWLAFAAGPLAQLVPNRVTRAIRVQRRPLGVAFAAALVVHSITIVMLSRSEPTVIAPNLEFAFGGFGVVFAVAMAATSTHAAMRRLGGFWRALHRTGQWWIFVIFAFSYGGRFAVDFAYWPAAAALVAVLGMRIAVHLRTRGRDAAPSPA